MGSMTPEKIQRLYRESKDATREWRTEAREMYDLVAGWQWTKTEEGELKEKKRLAVVMNRIAPYVDSIIGQQVNNRQELKLLPRGTDDGGKAEILTEAVRWVDDQCDAEDEITDSFGDMVICGMGATEQRMDYATDPEGRLISAERVDPLEMYWDTNATKRNLTDATWIMRARLMDAEIAEERWPAIKDASPDALMVDEEQETTAHDATEAPWYRGDGGARSAQAKQYLVLQIQHYEDATVYRIADPESGRLVTLTPNKFGKLKDQLDQWGVKYAKGTERKFYQCWVAGQTMLESGPAPSQRGFTFNFMCAKRDRNRRQWHGIVRALKDPQKFSNKFFSDFMHIFATNRKGGAFVEIDALSDPRKAEAEWNAPDALIKLNPGGLNKVRERDAGVFPSGLDRLIQYAVDAVPSVSGMSPEMMGLADRAQAGVVEAQRKASSLTILAPLFDALRRYMKERGVVLVDMIREYISDGRLVRIVGEDGERFVPLLKDEGTLKYDVIVDQAGTAANSKEQTFIVLQQLLPFAAKMGLPIPPDVLKYLPIPESLSEKWLEMVNGAQQQPDPQAEAEKMKMEMEQEKARIQMQLKQMDAQAKQQQTALTMEQQRQEAALKEREMMLTAQIKQQEFALKQMELAQREKEIEATERAAVADIEIKRADTEGRMREESQRSNDMRESFSTIVQALMKSQQEQQAGWKQLAELLTSEREVIRDARGRAVGTRVKKQTVN